jgi:hypothetical protein
VSAGSSGEIWGLDAQNNAYRYDQITQSWTPKQPGETGGLRSVCATSDGSVFGLSTSGNVYRFHPDGQRWDELPVPEPMNTIGAGAAGWLWGIGAQSSTIYQYDGSTRQWPSMPNPFSDTLLTLSTGDDTSVWGLSAGDIYRWVGATQQWQCVPNVSDIGPIAMVQISVGDATHIWGIASEAPFQYTLARPSWQALTENSGVAISQVSVGSAAHIVALDTSGMAYQVQPSASTVSLVTLAGSSLQSLSAAADGSVWGITQPGLGAQLVQYAAGAWQPPLATPAPYTYLAQVSAAHANDVWVLDWQGNIYRNTGPLHTWTQIPSGSTGGLASISAASDGTVWGANKDQQVFIFNGDRDGDVDTDLWYRTSARLREVSVGSMTNIWGIDRDGGWFEYGAPYTLYGEDGAVVVMHCGTTAPTWDTEDPFDEAQSTHLWIVNRAAELARQDDLVGNKIVALIEPRKGRTGGVFHDNLCQGLYDADPLLGAAQRRLVVRNYYRHRPELDAGWSSLCGHGCLIGKRASAIESDSAPSARPSPTAYRPLRDCQRG